jgi:glycosyltransferase involved in cell wall biosynthesis
MDALRPLHLNAFRRGGAFRAVERLVEAQKLAGAEPVILSELGGSTSQSALQYSPFYLRPFMRRNFTKALNWHLRHLKHTDTLFSTSDGWHPLDKILHHFPNDILHLHWISCNFLPIDRMPYLKSPLVWTLHDMWGFTGGCHHSKGCTRYETTCGECPLLSSKKIHDKSYQTIQSKQQYWSNLNLTIVTPSRWLADCARRSTVLGKYRIEIIPNPLDHSQFPVLDRAESRRVLGLHPDRKYIAFGAADVWAPHKGFLQLISAIEQLKAIYTDLELLVFGASNQDVTISGIPVHYLGAVSDDSLLNRIYCAADVFSSPSLEDNLPSTVMEALSSGTPVVAFGIGGIPDMVVHRENGYVAKPFEVDDLIAGISYILDHPQPSYLREAAHNKILREFSLESVGKRSLALYEELLDVRRS